MFVQHPGCVLGVGRVRRLDRGHADIRYRRKPWLPSDLGRAIGTAGEPASSAIADRGRPPGRPLTVEKSAILRSRLSQAPGTKENRRRSTGFSPPRDPVASVTTRCARGHLRSSVTRSSLGRYIQTWPRLKHQRSRTYGGSAGLVSSSCRPSSPLPRLGPHP